MTQQSLTKLLALALIGILLTACGGGGGSGEPNIAGGGFDASPDEDSMPTLTISILDPGTANSVSVVNGTDVVTVRAVVRDADGDLLAGIVVTFTTKDGIGLVVPLTGLTGSTGSDTGIAEITLQAGTLAGASEVSATAEVDGVLISSNAVGFQTDGLGSATGISAFSAVFDLTPDDIDRANPGLLTLTLIETATALPQAGALVVFSKTLGLFFDLAGNASSGSVFTDAQGVAQLELRAGTTAGAGEVSASITADGSTLEVTALDFITAGDAVPTLELEFNPGAGSTGASQSSGDIVSRTSAARVTATIIGSDNNPVQGILVDFSLSGAGELSASQDITNASGVAFVDILAGTVAGFGEVTATALVEGVAVANDSTDPDQQITFETLGDGPFEGVGASNLSIDLDLLDLNNDCLKGCEAGDDLAMLVDDAISADPTNGAGPGTLRATVLDAQGQAVEGIFVLFAKDLGDLSPSNGLVLTNAQGIAQAALTAGSVPGFGSATATILIDNQEFNSDAVSFESLGNAGNVIVVVTPSLSPSIITTASPGKLVVLVDDDMGQPLDNQQVTIVTTIGFLGPTGAGDPTTTVEESAGGRVTIAVNAIEGEIGPGGITVTVGDTSASIQFEVGIAGLQIGTFVGSVFTAGQMVVSISPLSAGGTSTISISAANDVGNPQKDIEIEFTTNCAEQTDPVSMETLALINSSVVTDNAGLASATYQANGCSGNDVITASETSSGSTASATIEILPPTTGSILFDSVSVDPNDPSVTSMQIKESGGITSGDVIFQVRDEFGDPAPDETVRFELTTEVGGLSLVSTAALTDSDGKVTATVSAGFIPTTVRVRASVDVDKPILVAADANGVPLNDPGANDQLIEDDTGVPVRVLVNNNGDFVRVILDANQSSPTNPAIAVDGQDVLFIVDANANLVADISGTVRFGIVEAVNANPRLGRLILDEDGQLYSESLTLVTLSDQLTVNTGVPDQNSMSMVASNLSIEGDGFDGSTSSLIVRMADFFNNPVPDGTSVSFTTELGSIEPTCSTVAGVCTVTLTSQEPRTPLNPNVSFNTVDEDLCPLTRINREQVTPSGNVANTAYTASAIHIVVNSATPNVQLTEGVAYNVDADGSGITCITAVCNASASPPLLISYDRTFLDQAPNGNIDTPGTATAPFTGVKGIPCVAGSRDDSDTLTGYGIQTPGFTNAGMGQRYGGRSTILATAQGEESFIDTNGNGIYDFGEPFVDLTEAFLDKNEDNVFGNGTPALDDSRDASNPDCYAPQAPIDNPTEVPDQCYQDGGEEETFVDFGDSGTLNNQFDAGNGIYNGTLCPKEIDDRTAPAQFCDNSAANPCSNADDFKYCTRDLVNIRRDLIVILAGSGARIAFRAQNELIASVDLTAAGLAFDEFTASTSVIANDGTVIAASATFTIGNTVSATVVSPGVGDLASLTTGSSSIRIDISDRFNGVMPGGTSVAVSSGSGGCEITNSPGFTQADTNGLGFFSTFVGLKKPDAPAPSAGTSVQTTVTSGEFSVQSAASFFCFH